MGLVSPGRRGSGGPGVEAGLPLPPTCAAPRSSATPHQARSQAGSDSVRRRAAGRGPRGGRGAGSSEARSSGTVEICTRVFSTVTGGPNATVSSTSNTVRHQLRGRSFPAIGEAVHLLAGGGRHPVHRAAGDPGPGEGGAQRAVPGEEAFHDLRVEPAVPRRRTLRGPAPSEGEHQHHPNRRPRGAGGSGRRGAGLHPRPARSGSRCGRADRGGGPGGGLHRRRPATAPGPGRRQALAAPSRSTASGAAASRQFPDGQDASATLGGGGDVDPHRGGGQLDPLHLRQVDHLDPLGPEPQHLDLADPFGGVLVAGVDVGPSVPAVSVGPSVPTRTWMVRRVAEPSTATTEPRGGTPPLRCSPASARST